jgi:hypothetical protein
MAFIHSPKVVTNGLILTLDAANNKSYPGSGTIWNDLSGNNNSGSLTSGPVFDGQNGGTFVFDGIDDVVNITNITETVWQGNWTVCASMKFDVINTTTAGASDRPLLHHGIANTRQGLHLTQRSSVFYFGLYGDDLQGGKVLSTNTWYYVTFTLNNSTYEKQIYVNGEFDRSNISGAYVGAGTNTRIAGPSLGFGLYFDGNISNVSIYNRVLSAQEILQNFNATRGRFGV